MSDALTLLRALSVYETWHTPGFLVGKGLLSPEWHAAYANLLAEQLEREGLVVTRFSTARKCLMYKITLAGAERLSELVPVRS